MGLPVPAKCHQQFEVLEFSGYFEDRKYSGRSRDKVRKGESLLVGRGKKWVAVAKRSGVAV